MSMFDMKAEKLNRKASEGAEKVMESLGIHKGDTVADLGSSGGYFTYIFSNAVGECGKVFAVDTNESLLEFVAQNVKKRRLGNVELISASRKEPNLPDNSCDLIFVRDVFHHIEDTAEYFGNIKKSLKMGGRIAIIDWKNEGHHLGHGTSKEQIIQVMESAGYKCTESFNFLEKQSFVIFKAAK